MDPAADADASNALVFPAVRVKILITKASKLSTATDWQIAGPSVKELTRGELSSPQ
jgi:hypothetical protein